MKPTKKPTSDYTKFSRAITMAIKKHLASGGKLYAGGFVSPIDESICPLTCLLVYDKASGNSNIYSLVARSLVIQFDVTDMWAFIDGFDMNALIPKNFVSNKYYKLGRRLRSKYLPITK